MMLDVASPMGLQGQLALNHASHSSLKEDIDAWMFDADSTDRIPRRAGYYIGAMIARRLATRVSFSQLCRLQGDDLRREIRSALRSIRTP